jgi:putative membrane protein
VTNGAVELGRACGWAAALARHPARPGDLGDLARSWTWEPAVVVPLALAAWLYFRGVNRLWRGADRARGVRDWEAAAYGAGWATLFVALVSPLHAWGGALFSAHMAQHELLMLVAAPLLVLGRPLVPFLWALPVEWRRRLGAAAKTAPWRQTWRFATAPLVAWSLHAAALWVWHAPALYSAAVESEAVHTLQHLSFFLSALLFWWAIVHGRPGPAARGASVLYLFTTSAHSGALGALLTFAARPLYAVYASSTGPWGLSQLEDQQIGGLVMWIPAGLVYIAAALALFASWLRESDRRVDAPWRRATAEEVPNA